MTIPNARNTKLRIDFVVREVCEDGSVPDEDLRFIKFGDFTSHVYVKDFFDRCGHAMGLMFKPDGGHVIAAGNFTPNKISTIKVVRELTNFGLKEAKDVVEAPGTPFLIVHNYDDLKHVVKLLEDTGCKLDVRPYNAENIVPRVGFRAPAEYVRRL